MEDRVAAVDYEWQAIGENLAAGQSNAAQVVATWMSSPPHRANLLSTAFTETGAGVAFGADGRSYYVQVFARPRS